MKKLYFLALLLCNVSLYAQDPNIVGTWYLHYFPVDLDAGTPLILGDAPKNPYITINPDYSYEGVAACNTFSGNLVYNTTLEAYENTNFSKTNNTCITSQYNEFESRFFTELAYPQFYISGDDNNLTLETIPGFGLEFKENPLFPDPVFQGTWYLSQMVVDLGETYFIENINPAIQPSITIFPDLTYTGQGACNTFSGTLIEDPNNSNGQYISQNFITSTNTCATPYLEMFDMDFITHLEDGSFRIDLVQPQSGTIEMNVLFNIFSTMKFSNQPILNIANNTNSNFTIFPNPTKDKIFIVYKKDTPTLVSVFNVSGQKVLNTTSDTQIDLSTLSDGIYFIKMITENREEVVKIVKN